MLKRVVPASTANPALLFRKTPRIKYGVNYAFYSGSNGKVTQFGDHHQLSWQAPQPLMLTSYKAWHSKKLVDPYLWMLESKHQAKLIAHIEQENKYCQDIMQQPEIKTLTTEFYQELATRVSKDDEYLLLRHGNYDYYCTTYADQAYPVYLRKDPQAPQASEQIVLDVNKLAVAAGKPVVVTNLTINPNGKYLAYLQDNNGDDKFTIKFIDLDNMQHLSYQIENVASDFAWANDSETFFYTRFDPQTLRVCTVYRHRLFATDAETGLEANCSQLVYTEFDPAYFVSLSTSKSKKYILVKIESIACSTEYLILSAEQPQQNFQIFLPRRKGHEYYLEHYNAMFYIRTNYQADNFRIMQLAEANFTRELLLDLDKFAWQDIIGHDPNLYIDKFAVFNNYLLVQGAKTGVNVIAIKKIATATELLRYIKLPPEFSGRYYQLEIDSVWEPQNYDHLLDFTISALGLPPVNCCYNLNSSRYVKIAPNYAENFNYGYTTERCYAVANDGEKIQITLAYRTSLKLAQGNPLLLTGYGAYGGLDDVGFDPQIISLLDRGYVYAIAHIRGSCHLGSQWYAAGRALNTKNTFSDFISCAEHLITNKYAASDQLFAYGVSAGGLLMAVAANMRPELFTAIIAEVPYVDVITTMTNVTRPWVTLEHNEWGDPRKSKEVFDYMLSYSPIENIDQKPYPAMLIMTGQHDSIVNCTEAIRWGVTLRDKTTSGKPIIINVDTQAGHHASPNIFQKINKEAIKFAFLEAARQKLFTKYPCGIQNIQTTKSQNIPKAF